MKRTWLAAGVAAATACVSMAVAMPGVASAKSDGNPKTSESSFTMAVIGDIPYGDAQIALFPNRVDQLNAVPGVDMVTHLGDIKSGSSRCDDSYFAAIKAQFDRFDDPLVYTPGDNEWTDCHRPNNGAYNPLERLDAIRNVFFATPGQTLGMHPVAVDSQASYGYPENVDFERAKVEFAALHVVGSNNSLLPWTGQTAPTPEQTAEVLGRTAADIQLIHDTFDKARTAGGGTGKAKAVLLMMQADMFDPTVPSPKFAEWYGFQPIVQAIAQEAASYDGQVYLLNGDSHVYEKDNPLAAGSSWTSFYGVAPVSNLTRVTIDGSTGVHDWLKVSANRGDVSFEVVPFNP